MSKNKTELNNETEETKVEAEVEATGKEAETVGVATKEAGETRTHEIRGVHKRKLRRDFEGLDYSLYFPEEEKDQDLHYRFVRGKANRIKKLEERGYAVVNIPGKGNDERKTGDEDENLYLMSIPKEWYAEDQKAKAKALDERMGAIEKGKIVGKEGQTDQGIESDKRVGENIRITRGK